MSNRFKIGSFGKVLVRYTSAQIVANFSRMLAGFLVIKFIEPEIYGQFSGIGIYLGYILYGQIGIVDGLAREMPFEKGRGNINYAVDIASSTYGFSLLISTIAALIFFIFFLENIVSNQYLNGLIYLGYAFIACFYLMNQFLLPTLYQTSGHFNLLAKINIFTGFGSLLTVILVWLFGVYGLIIRGVILAFFEFYLLFKNKPYRLKFDFKFSLLKELFKTGFPIYIVAQITPIWVTIMKNIIFSVGGALSYGLFSLSIIIDRAASIIPNAFSGVIYPKMSTMLGKGNSASQILKKNAKPLMFQLLVMLIIGIIGVILLPIIVPKILPKYVDGIKAAQWILFVSVARSFATVNSIFNVFKKQKWYLLALVIGVLVGSIYVYIQIQRQGFSLEVFPQGMVLGRILQQVLGLVFIKLLIKHNKLK